MRKIKLIIATVFLLLFIQAAQAAETYTVFLPVVVAQPVPLEAVADCRNMTGFYECPYD